MRVALVTGAARGIGAATVRRLVAQGYAVTAFDSCAEDNGETDYSLASKADLDAVVATAPDQILGHVGDVRDRAALEAALAATLERWGRLDAVVAAAAVMAGGQPLWDTPQADLDLLWDVDVVGVWNTAAVTMPALLASENPTQCRFVAVSSAAAQHGLHRLAAYSTVKHAVAGLVAGLAADLVGTGVTAACVSPGSTRTAMLEETARVYGLESVEEFTSSSLLQRVLDPDEVAAAIAFCCSIDGGVVNGSTVQADGGFTG